MKRLLLALLVSVMAIPALEAASAAPVPTEDNPAVFLASLGNPEGTTALQSAPAMSSPSLAEPGAAPVLAADRCVYRMIHYYTSPGGQYCGVRYMYCTPPNVQDGCVTPYWQVVYAGCVCP